MDDAMVTGRMPADKKTEGNAILGQAGLNASQAVNLLYDRLIEEHDAGFLTERTPSANEWKVAARFVDALAAPEHIETPFDGMTRGEIKLHRFLTREQG